MKNNIKYSLCWEDPQLVTRALQISRKDVVLTVASGGENVFALLLQNPKKVIAIDNNLSQIFLVRLKAAAIKTLEFEEFLEFVGLRQSSQRLHYLDKCLKHLQNDEIAFWNSMRNKVEKGIMHCGKFESYLRIFRKYILSLVLTKEQILHYLSSSNLQQQRQFYYTCWETVRWRLLFRLFFSKSLMQILGRDKSYFKNATMGNIANHYYTQARKGITQIPVKDNYFMHLILRGIFPTPFKHHPYADKQNFEKLKIIVDTIVYIHNDVTHYLQQSKENITKYNLSDIFEKCSQQAYEEILEQISKRSNKGTRICYWNNLVPRKHHPVKKLLNVESEQLRREDRVFFYSDFIIEEKI